MKFIENKPETIQNAFIELGFSSFDIEKCRIICEYYREFSWCLIPHHRVSLVLYAVPLKDKLDELPWESWYLDGGKEIHHVHYSTPRHPDDFQWIQKEKTEERPQEVIDRVWYWYDEPDMIPVLVSGAMEKER